MIRIFSLSGDLITTLNYEAPASAPNSGKISWNLFSESGRPLASGLYIFAVESDIGRQIGNFALIR